MYPSLSRYVTRFAAAAADPRQGIVLQILSRGGGVVNSSGSHPGGRRFKSGPRNHKSFGKEGDIETGGATGIAVLLTQVDTLTTLMGNVWTVMVANPLLCAMLGSSLLVVGIRLFKRIKSAAR